MERRSPGFTSGCAVPRREGAEKDETNLLIDCHVVKPIYRIVYHRHVREKSMRNRRTIITISEEDKSWLASYSCASGISMAEAVRRSIMRLKVQDAKSAYQSLVRQTKGVWKKGDGLAYQKKLRSEWR
jgi:hypothetical protein